MTPRLHYFEVLNGFLPGALLRRAFFAALVSLILFFVISLFDFPGVLTTNLFLLQLNFSFTIFLGFLFGGRAFLEFKTILRKLEIAFDLKGKQSLDFRQASTNLLAKPVGHLFSLPFISAAFYVVVNSRPELQASLGVDPRAPTFIYAIYIECCIFMLDLLGGTGYWLMFSVFFVLKDLERRKLKFHLANIEKLKGVSAIIRTLSIMLFLIILSLLPGIVFIANQLNQSMDRFLMYMGVILPVAVLLTSFLLPSFALDRLLRSIKEAKLERLHDQMIVLEREVFSSPGKRGDHLRIGTLQRLHALRDQTQYLQKHTSFVFSFSSLSEITASALLSPLVTYVLQRFIGGSS